MADSIYVKVGNEVEPLDLGGGSSPEYVERIEALEAFAETQAAKDEAQDEAIAEAKSSAEAANQGLVGVVRSVNGTAADVAGNVDIAELASGWGMPSNRYSFLTLGASGASYTAPANGHFMFRRRLGEATAQYIGLTNVTKSYIVVTTLKGDVGNELTAICPATKGDTVQAYYTANGIVEAFCFYYAEGAK